MRCSLTRWSETTAVWSPVFTGVTSSTVSSVNLEIHPTLGPVMCFQDSSNGGKASCLRYVGGNSTAYVGAPGMVTLVQARDRYQALPFGLQAARSLAARAVGVTP
jgi:hypothetical protein